MEKQNIAFFYSRGHNILRLYQIFFSPQVKRSVVINKKRSIFNLFPNMSNDLKNEKILGKSQKFIEL